MQKTVRVWGPLIRVFHWSLVIAFFTSYLSGDENETIHIYSGYIVLGLIVFRLLWGFIGGKYARFSQFICSPKAAFAYITSLIRDNSIQHIGHNPAGGLMVVAVLICLLVVTFSGLKVYALEEGKGLLSENNIEFSVLSQARANDVYEKSSKHQDSPDEEFWEETHEVSVNLMLLLIVIHIIGVIASSRAHNSNLTKAMITGKKVIKTVD